MYLCKINNTLDIVIFEWKLGSGYSNVCNFFIRNLKIINIENVLNVEKTQPDSYNNRLTEIETIKLGTNRYQAIVEK